MLNSELNVPYVTCKKFMEIKSISKELENNKIVRFTVEKRIVKEIYLHFMCYNLKCKHYSSYGDNNNLTTLHKEL